MSAPMATEEWRPMETAPEDGTQIRVKLSTGRVVAAEFWAGPPGYEHWGGWATDALASFVEDTAAADAEAEMVGWLPLAPASVTEDEAP